jgi:N-acetylneuraminic acid mutarotase
MSGCVVLSSGLQDSAVSCYKEIFLVPVLSEVDVSMDSTISLRPKTHLNLKYVLHHLDRKNTSAYTCNLPENGTCAGAINGKIDYFQITINGKINCFQRTINGKIYHFEVQFMAKLPNRKYW